MGKKLKSGGHTIFKLHSSSPLPLPHYPIKNERSVNIKYSYNKYMELTEEWANLMVEVTLSSLLR